MNTISPMQPFTCAAVSVPQASTAGEIAHRLPTPREASVKDHASWTWLTVVLYALAMAWVESAVVFYLRSLIDRLVPFQPNPLPFAGGFGFAEIVREVATMVMLLAVGWLAGRTWRSRLAYALLAFGVWDIAYYLWLVPLTGWPLSLTDWDILFLIPLPWWGPVWAPVSIAVLLILFGALVARNDTPENPLWPGKTSLVAAFAGIMLSLYVFMADAIHLLAHGGNTAQLRDLLPQWFNWPLFLVALGLLAMPVVEVIRRVWISGAIARNQHCGRHSPEFNCAP
ncbi:MAG: hypothetical protein HY043_05595 [Verrucomicrobia bacterium]|nr:hypothetical protein [Verrucomicrobiota bacterium]